MENTNENRSFGYNVLVFILIIIVAIIAIKFLTPWFASFGMFFKLVMTYLAFEYLLGLLLDIWHMFVEYVNKTN